VREAVKSVNNLLEIATRFGRDAIHLEPQIVALHPRGEADISGAAKSSNGSARANRSAALTASGSGPDRDWIPENDLWERRCDTSRPDKGFLACVLKPDSDNDLTLGQTTPVRDDFSGGTKGRTLRRARRLLSMNLPSRSAGL